MTLEDSKKSEKLGMLSRLDEISDLFETAWNAGEQRPSIEEFQKKFSDVPTQRLIRELVELEIELRKRAGESPAEKDYTSRFSDLDAEWLRKALLGPSTDHKTDRQSGTERIIQQPYKDDSTRFAGPNHPAQISKSFIDTDGSVSAIETSEEFQFQDHDDVSAGDRVGRYEILELVGGGGMGKVFRARDNRLNREVAIKMPKILVATKQEKQELIQRFHREARAMASLNHPNLCQVHDVDQDGDLHFIVMSLVRGEALSDRLARVERLDVSSALSVCRKIALGLYQAHRNRVIHRDLKPANIMLTVDLEPVVVDFGLARRPLEQNSGINTSAGKIVGTLAYMSPEQAQGANDDLTHSTDIFSLGTILFQLLTGQLPFEGKGISILSQILMNEPPLPSSIRPELPEAVDELVSRLLKKKPEDRFESMLDVANAIDEICREELDHALVQRIERKTLSAGFQHDVFVSFAPSDDLGDEPDGGWISQFIRDLEWRICLANGNPDEISVTFASDPIRQARAGDFDHARSNLMLIVNSADYGNNLWPIDELKSFRQVVAQKAELQKLVVVETEKIQAEDSPRFEMANPMRFWHESSEGDQELLSRQNQRERYLEKIDDLARLVLSRLREPTQNVADDESTKVAEKFTVFLAEVTDDLEPVREDIRRYLEQSNIEVLPKSWYGRARDEYLQAMDTDLSASKLFVQLVGPVIGRKGQGVESSYAQLQFDQACSRAMPMLQWRNPDVVDTLIEDVNHRKLVFGSGVQASTVQEFKHEIDRAIQKQKDASKKDGQQETLESFVFLNVDQKDVESAEPICQILDESGVCYAMTLHDGSPTEIRRDVEENFVECDGLLIYYGAATGQWVREQLRNWRRTLHRREKPVKALAIFEGPPDEKPSIGMRLPNLEVLNCRNGLDASKIHQFLDRLRDE